MIEITYYDQAGRSRSKTVSMTPDGAVGAFCSGCDNQKPDGGCEIIKSPEM
jgi:hypothetical protein